MPATGPRVLGGLGLSLLVHAALLLAWRGWQAPPRVEQEGPRALSVWIRPVPPPPPPIAKVEPPTQAKSATGTVRKPVAPKLIALPEPAASKSAPPDMFAVAPQPETPPAPRFDPDAARSLARKLVHERDPAKAGTAVGQLPEKELETETKAARLIAQAKRPDCKDGLPGGLLGPLIILFDKKDSGCKW